MPLASVCPNCSRPLGTDAALCPHCLLLNMMGPSLEFNPDPDFTLPQWEHEELPELGPGALLGERYLIEQEIGRGGFSVVYQAFDRGPLQRRVAVKLLRPRDKSGAPGGVLADVSLELRLAGALAHPHIARVYDAGPWQSGLYMVQELLEGQTLADYHHERQRLEGEEIYAIVGAVCDALGFAHERGVVHCDVKPGNIFRDTRGGIKVMDFGLARVMTRGVALDLVAGTPEYMAPEQGRGQNIDARVDVFSLGCVIFELFTGELPYPPRRHWFSSPSPLPLLTRPASIPPPIWRVLVRALAEDPQQRPTNAVVLGQLLRQAQRQGRRLRWATGVLMVLLPTLVVGVAGRYLYLSSLEFVRLPSSGVEPRDGGAPWCLTVYQGSPDGMAVDHLLGFPRPLYETDLVEPWFHPESLPVLSRGLLLSTDDGGMRQLLPLLKPMARARLQLSWGEVGDAVTTVQEVMQGPPESSTVEEVSSLVLAISEVKGWDPVLFNLALLFFEKVEGSRGTPSNPLRDIEPQGEALAPLLLEAPRAWWATRVYGWLLLPSMQDSAIRILERVGGPEDSPHLLPLLQVADLAEQTFRALNAIRGCSVLPAVREVLFQGPVTSTMAKEGIFLLGACGSADDVPGLSQLILHPPPGWTPANRATALAAALVTVERLVPGGAKPWLDGLLEEGLPREVGLRALVGVHLPLPPRWRQWLVEEGLKGEDPSLVAAAARRMGIEGYTEGAAVSWSWVTGHLQSLEGLFGLRGLQAIRDTRLRQALLELLMDSQTMPKIRQQVLRQLVTQEPSLEVCAEMVHQGMGDDQGVVEQSFLLMRFLDRACVYPPLQRWAEQGTPHQQVRAEAGILLSTRAGDPSRVLALVSRYNHTLHDMETSFVVYLALRHTYDTWPVEQVVALVTDHRPVVRVAAILSLALRPDASPEWVKGNDGSAWQQMSRVQARRVLTVVRGLNHQRQHIELDLEQGRVAQARQRILARFRDWAGYDRVIRAELPIPWLVAADQAWLLSASARQEWWMGYPLYALDRAFDYAELFGSASPLAQDPHLSGLSAYRSFRVITGVESAPGLPEDALP